MHANVAVQFLPVAGQNYLGQGDSFLGEVYSSCQSLSDTIWPIVLCNLFCGNRIYKVFPNIHKSFIEAVVFILIQPKFAEILPFLSYSYL